MALVARDSDSDRSANGIAAEMRAAKLRRSSCTTGAWTRPPPGFRSVPSRPSDAVEIPKTTRPETLGGVDCDKGVLRFGTTCIFVVYVRVVDTLCVFLTTYV